MGVFPNGDFHARAVLLQMFFYSAEDILKMTRCFHWNLSECVRKWRSLILAFLWIAGLSFGIFLHIDLGQNMNSWMPGVQNCPLSIVGLLISIFLPFLFAAFAVYVDQPWLLALVCFFKALSVSFVSCLVFSPYGQRGWILRLLAMFHEDCACLMLLLFSQRHFFNGRRLSLWELPAFLIMGVLAAAASYFFFGPLLMGLTLT